MRLPGRIAAAADVLSDIDKSHRPASAALNDWGTRHRFAGAGDRAAIGNLVYDALRRRASIASRMEGDTPWHLAVGAAVLVWGIETSALNEQFAGDRHAPPPIPADLLERLHSPGETDIAPHIHADIPEWIVPHFENAFGSDWAAEGEALAARPPLDLRVNVLRADREKAARQLARLGVEPTPLSPVGLRIPPAEGAQRHPNIQAEEAYLRGRIEVQDEGSQICALLVGAAPGEQVLDICAGAGGKTLALAAAMGNRGQLYAYDRDRNRLAPIYDRLQRAGARNVQVRPPGPGVLDDLAGRMDRVLVDAPCTGTGIWRRRPDAKWRLRPEAIEKRTAEQDRALDEAVAYVRAGGTLVYSTCSVLPMENGERIAAFLARHRDFGPLPMHDVWAAALPGAEPPYALDDTALLLTPRRTGTDGFYCAAMRRAG